MPIRKALLSLLAKVPLLKGMNQPSLQQSSINDSREDLEASSRKIGYSKEGLDAKYKWIREHKAAIRVGKQLVQHEMHIVAQLLYIENLADEKGSLTPSHEDQILKYEAELKQINHEYMEYRERINELESYKPLGHMASQHLHLYGHRAYSQAWNMEAYWCRVRRGCCAGDCGCCERSFRTIRDRKGGMRQMHCLRGCSCCQRHRGEFQVSTSSAGRDSHSSGERSMTPEGCCP
ncbi:hypothetical protein PENSUB_12796 [Penicillium subrubescens]|uniref:Uncharacterized protein n=1 Tax=Penicillium subrubescens TaxID=1316194 RepID=A0A1Q5SW67_9EURO|nr:hypothetical protein PENSUB_12796 [Penicillium subrubescens]